MELVALQKVNTPSIDTIPLAPIREEIIEDEHDGGLLNSDYLSEAIACDHSAQYQVISTDHSTTEVNTSTPLTSTSRSLSLSKCSASGVDPSVSYSRQVEPRYNNPQGLALGVDFEEINSEDFAYESDYSISSSNIPTSEYELDDYSVSRYKPSDGSTSTYDLNCSSSGNYEASPELSQYQASDDEISDYKVSDHTTSDIYTTRHNYTPSSDYSVSDCTPSVNYQPSNSQVSDYPPIDGSTFRRAAGIAPLTINPERSRRVDYLSSTNYNLSDYSTSNSSVPDHSTSDYSTSNYSVPDHSTSDYSTSDYSVPGYDYSSSDYSESDYLPLSNYDSSLGQSSIDIQVDQSTTVRLEVEAIAATDNGRALAMARASATIIRR